MYKKIKQIITVLALGFMLAVPAVATVSAQEADIDTGLKCGANLDAQALDDCNDDVSSGSGAIDNIVTTVINVFSWVVGVVSVIMIIFGGFQYITSAGDSSKVGTAKNTIMYAIIGLVIVALSQFIVRFVLDRVTE